MALDGLGLSYVEDFAMGIGESRLIHHAWLTPDGLTAIDLVADGAGRERISYASTIGPEISEDKGHTGDGDLKLNILSH